MTDGYINRCGENMTNPTDCSRVVEALGNATVYAETVQAVADPTEKECTSSGVCCLAIECSNSKFVGDSMTKKAAAAMLVPTGIILFLLAVWFENKGLVAATWATSRPDNLNEDPE